jgi:hypothetical protein
MSYEVVFNSSRRSGRDSKLIVRANDSNEIQIHITNSNGDSEVICLERLAASKLAKELRRQISYLQD